MSLWPWQSCQKAWWSCQSWWDVDGYAWGGISLQGPGYFCKTRQWHLPWCDGSLQWCLSLLAGNGWGTRHLAGNSQGDCNCGNSELWVPYTIGHGKRTPRVGSLAPAAAPFPHGFFRFCWFRGSGWSYLHPRQWFLGKDILIGEQCQKLHSFP